MSETVLVALITGGFTLASGIVGVILTHRYTRAQADTVRADAQRRDTRALVAQFVYSGTQWASQGAVVVPAYFNAAANDDKNFWMEWPDTDSGTAYREHALTIKRTAGELRLVVTDPKLLEAISHALAAMADSGAMTRLLEEARRSRGRDVKPGTYGDAFEYFERAELAFQAVEQQAAKTLQGAV